MYSTSRDGNPSNNKRRDVSFLTPIIISLFDYGCDQLTSLDLCHPLQMQINSVIHYLFRQKEKETSIARYQCENEIEREKERKKKN